MSQPTLVVLSLGAGVQSTALALMACEGILPRPDVAVFADTGWEPEAVYENVARLDRDLAAVGVPLHRVGRGGRIQDDVLDPFVFATLPAYVVTEETVRKPLTWHLCDCVWADLHRAGHSIDDIERLAVSAAKEDGPTTAEVEAEVEYEDGWHADQPLTFVDILHAVSLDQVPPPCAQCHFGRVVTNWHEYTVEHRGTIKRQCTGKYKVEPVEKKIRELLGAPIREVECRYCVGSGLRIAPWDPEAGVGACSVCRGSGMRRLVDSPLAGARAEQWIGFSTDEVTRVTTAGFPSYTKPSHPLIDLGMSRQDCLEFLRARGRKVGKSACVGCPFHRNAFWRDMRDNRPQEWAQAVAFDRRFRRAPGLRGRRYLHESFLPLDEAPIDQLTRREERQLQTNLLDLTVVGDDAPGCSPFGCHSGAAVTP